MSGKRLIDVALDRKLIEFRLIRMGCPYSLLEDIASDVVVNLLERYVSRPDAVVNVYTVIKWAWADTVKMMTVRKPDVFYTDQNPEGMAAGRGPRRYIEHLPAEITNARYIRECNEDEVLAAEERFRKESVVERSERIAEANAAIGISPRGDSIPGKRVLKQRKKYNKEIEAWA